MNDLNESEISIMQFVDWWVHEKKTPIPRAKIVEKMQEEGVGMSTTRQRIYNLIKKGYLREAVTVSNKTLYVQLRSISI